MPRLHRDPQPCSVSILADFYRQELLKHRDCLERQREYFSDRAITDAEAGLMRVIARLDQLCACGEANDLVECVLRKFDVVTGLSALATLSDPGKLH
jgi:hypothetical protein